MIMVKPIRQSRLFQGSMSMQVKRRHVILTFKIAVWFKDVLRQIREGAQPGTGQVMQRLMASTKQEATGCLRDLSSKN